MKEDKEIKSNKGSTSNKIKKLQRQYNKILVDLFDQFAAESIEEALDNCEGSFGENIQDIVQCALDNLKGKVMSELGVKGDTAIVAIDGISMDLGTASDGGTGDGEDAPHFEGETEEEHAEHEAEETPEEEAEEHAEGESEAEEKDEDKPVEEGMGRDEDDLDEEDDKAGFIKHINRFRKMNKKGKIKKIKKPDISKEPKEESIKIDKALSKARRSDQVSLTEAYLDIYKKT